MSDEPVTDPGRRTTPAPDPAVDHRADAEAVLSVEELRKEFAGVVALDGADLTVRRGEIVGVVGPNGAGKTTLFNCVLGELAPTAGRILLNDADITGLRTSEIVSRGLSRTYQIPRVFPELTVYENMVVNQSHRGESMIGTTFKETDEDTEARIYDLLEFVDLEGMATEPAGELSTGQQKLLNIASTLLRDPTVVLLDEPTAGVAPALVEDITDLILGLHEDGRTFLVIEHDMDVIRRMAEHVYVLANGRNLTEGPPETALSDPQVLEAYFGE